MSNSNYQAIEDNGGGLHLAVFNGDQVTYFSSGFEHNIGLLRTTIDSLKSGDSPDGWDGNSDNPQAEYNNITSYKYGWEIVADQDGIYPDLMGGAAQLDFGIGIDD